MKKIPGNLLKKTWKNHGNIMKFCQSEKVGTLRTSCGGKYRGQSLFQFPHTNTNRHSSF